MHQGIDNACLTEAIGLASGAVDVKAGSRPHRHNEVELNFLERGAITYLFGKQKIVVSAGQLIVFWAIMPHSIIEAVPETTMQDQFSLASSDNITKISAPSPRGRGLQEVFNSATTALSGDFSAIAPG